MLHEEILACRRCAVAGHHVEGRPVLSGDPQIVTRQARVMLVGQAPGRTEAGNGRPFSGPAGRRLFQWLAMAGIEESAFRQEVYMAAMTRCYPGPAASGHGDRRPSRQELALCRGYLDRAMWLVRPQVVVLVGGMAIDALLGKAPLSQLVGTVHMRSGVAYLPLPHPSGASTWFNQPAHRALLDQALRTLGGLWQQLGLANREMGPFESATSTLADAPAVPGPLAVDGAHPESPE